MLTSHGFWQVVPLCPSPSTSTTHSPKHFHLHLYIYQKIYSFLEWMVSCVIFHKMLFYKDVTMWGGEILISTKWKQELKCNILFLKHSKKTLQFGLVYCWRMLMIMAQVFVDKFLSFGVVTNAPWHYVNGR